MSTRVAEALGHRFLLTCHDDEHLALDAEGRHGGDGVFRLRCVDSPTVDDDDLPSDARSDSARRSASRIIFFGVRWL
jgi:hypothetical protein